MDLMLSRHKTIEVEEQTLVVRVDDLHLDRGLAEDAERQLGLVVALPLQQGFESAAQLQQLHLARLALAAEAGVAPLAQLGKRSTKTLKVSSSCHRSRTAISTRPAT